jgi:hypothetical protein
MEETPATVAANLLIEQLNEKERKDEDLEITSFKLKRHMEDYKLRSEMSSKKNTVELNHNLMFFKNVSIDAITRAFSPSNKVLKALLLDTAAKGKSVLTLPVASYGSSTLPFTVDASAIEISEHTLIALEKAYSNIAAHKSTNSLIDHIVQRAYANIADLWKPLDIKVSKSTDGIIRKSKVSFTFKW